MIETCKCCGQPILPRCDRCKQAYTRPGEPYQLPPPFGSLNAAKPVTVCQVCYQDYARLGWTWLGLDDPGPELFGWGDNATYDPTKPGYAQGRPVF